LGSFVRIIESILGVSWRKAKAIDVGFVIFGGFRGESWLSVV